MFSGLRWHVGGSASEKDEDESSQVERREEKRRERERNILRGEKRVKLRKKSDREEKEGRKGCIGNEAVVSNSLYILQAKGTCGIV